jgi:hypothetical protein
MGLQVTERQVDGDDHWAVVQGTCDLSDSNDCLLVQAVQLVRLSYGQQEIAAYVEALEAEAETPPDEDGVLDSLPRPDRSVEEEYDLEAILTAFRRGLPNPEAEGNKPVQLTNYRSETAEMLARAALEVAHDLKFPAAPQAGKPNANMPILGFDGWGVLEEDTTGYSLALVQVKGTESEACPSPEATTLAGETLRVPRQIDEICRAITVLLLRLPDGKIKRAILRMLESLGKNEPISIIVSPVILRGTTTADMAELEPVRQACQGNTEARRRGVVASIGASLTTFGRTVMEIART